MAYPTYIREKARELRTEKKLTIDELAERLALPRTTVYYWVRDLPIPRPLSDGWSEAARKKGSKAMQAKYRGLREAAYKQGQEEYPLLLREPTFRDFICMYIGEGSKRNRNAVAICNSDPAVIRLGATWIQRLATNPVLYSFQHHEDQDPEQLRLFWGEVVGIEPAAITFQRKSNSGRLNGRSWRSKHGVLMVRTPDTYLHSRIQAWMDCVRAEWP
jgi:predicted DNA-binding transcriptional regulator AlpA